MFKDLNDSKNIYKENQVEEILIRLFDIMIIYLQVKHEAIIPKD